VGGKAQHPLHTVQMAGSKKTNQQTSNGKRKRFDNRVQKNKKKSGVRIKHQEHSKRIGLGGPGSPASTLPLWGIREGLPDHRLGVRGTVTFKFESVKKKAEGGKGPKDVGRGIGQETGWPKWERDMSQMQQVAEPRKKGGGCGHLQSAQEGRIAVRVSPVRQGGGLKPKPKRPP